MWFKQLKISLKPLTHFTSFVQEFVKLMIMLIYHHENLQKTAGIVSKSLLFSVCHRLFFRTNCQHLVQHLDTSWQQCHKIQTTKFTVRKYKFKVNPSNIRLFYSHPAIVLASPNVTIVLKYCFQVLDYIHDQLVN